MDSALTEDYVSFGIAKLLKEKGFDWQCISYYVDDEPDDVKYSFCGETNSDWESRCCSAPTLQIVMKWLREVYNLHIITIPYAPMDRPPYHPGEADIVYIAQLFRGIIPVDEVGRSIIKLTHEEACEAAIRYCLENLI